MNNMKRAFAAAVSAVLMCSAAAVPALPAGAVSSVEDAYSWGTMKIGGGGFVSGIVTGKEVMYARTDVGGAYKYNYETESWEQLFDFLTEADRGLLSVDAMAIDPTDDDTVYFLCGCAYFSAEKTVIFKTTDGGKTFKEINVTDLIKVMGNGDGRQCGESIAVDPDNPNVIYAGGDVTAKADSKSALIKSTDGGETWEPVIGYDELGLFSETTKWPTWTDNIARSVTNGEYQTQNGIANIVISDGKVYVGTSAKDVGNVHVASTSDDKFELLSKDLPTDVFPSRLIADANGNIIITYIAALAFNGSAGGAYKYDVKAGTVTDISPCANGFGEVYPNPENPDHLVATTCGVWAGQLYSEDAWDRDAVAWGDQFFRSTDGGKTWEGITPGKEKYWNGPREADFIQDGGYAWIRDKAIHWVGSMVLDPRDPSRAFLTSGNGSFVCTDVWGELPVYTFHPDGIEEVVSLDFASSPDGLDLSAIGDYDGFVHNATDEIGLQYQPNMGSTGAIAICPQNTDVWARLAENDGSQAGKAFYTLDRGKTWTAFNPASTGGKLAIAELSEGKYRIFNSSSSGQLSYSDDFGGTWNQCSGISASKGVYTLVDPKDPSIVYASSVKHNDYWASDTTKTEPTFEESHYSFNISTDGGVTFTDIPVVRYDMCDHTGDLAYLGDGTIIMAAGWQGMYKISDQGKSVEKLENVSYAKCVGYGAPEKEGGLNALYIYGKPEESDPEGIYRSNDGGATWVCINTQHLYGGTGNGNYLVGDMDEYGKVYMSTVGCGIVYGEITGAEKPVDPTKPTEPDPSDTKPEGVLYGDANNDGGVDILDVIALNKYLLGTGELTDQGKVNANVDDSKEIDTTDSLNILKCVVKLIAQEDFPIK